MGTYLRIVASLLDFPPLSLLQLNHPLRKIEFSEAVFPVISIKIKPLWKNVIVFKAAVHAGEGIDGYPSTKPFTKQYNLYVHNPLPLDGLTTLVCNFPSVALSLQQYTTPLQMRCSTGIGGKQIREVNPQFGSLEVKVLPTNPPQTAT